MRKLVSTIRIGVIVFAAALTGLSAASAPVFAKGPVSVAELARSLSDTVVNIGTTIRLPDGGGMPFPDVPDGSPLEDFLDEHNPNQGQGEGAMREARSLGSGFIISADGLIVTNNHVIEGASEIQVFMTDGTRLPAILVGSDEKTDLAVLQVDAGRALDFVSFGDSDTAEIGDWVMAIGNPFGLGGSVTLGIVSARNRDISSGPYDNFIQTDAAINQGNSGGPLFDMDGKVVGINTAIISRGGGALGIGFAVPGNLAKPVIDQLAEFGETRRGWLGVGIQDVSDDIATSLGRDDTQGALVVEVTIEGPSDGVLEGGDLILEFDGKPIKRMRDLPRVVAETQVGKAVQVLVLRRGIEQVFDITLGRLEASELKVANIDKVGPEVAVDPEAVVAPGLPELVGLDAETLNSETRAELGIVDSVNGVLITRVISGSDADEKGLFPGLVIEEVNQKIVAELEDVSRIVDESKETGRPAVLFKIADPTGSRRFVAVRLQ